MLRFTVLPLLALTSIACATHRLTEDASPTQGDSGLESIEILVKGME